LENFNITGINEHETARDMSIQLGNRVLILGYPLGLSHFVGTPIWKAGTIASEPHLETPDSKGRVVIDATTRQGMSGAPVFMREKTHYLSEEGLIKKCANATRWIGIYASRPPIRAVAMQEDEDRRPEIGYFYKSGSVFEVIMKGSRASSFASSTA